MDGAGRLARLEARLEAAEALMARTLPHVVERAQVVYDYHVALRLFQAAERDALTVFPSVRL